MTSGSFLTSITIYCSDETMNAYLDKPPPRAVTFSWWGDCVSQRPG